ncbi:kyphoscoliosis peptidase [Elysia marginata]|uniref:Kyphoscoliosis peptidase n=1 Tax=Elysia marginata TaxID=1093978 RepID=A0AAV4EGY7_9GAST|nr:kyphoscoliosis peptidase [Elysia marginata]
MGCQSSKSSYALAKTHSSTSRNTRQFPHSDPSKNSFEDSGCDGKSGESNQRLIRHITTKAVIVPDIKMFEMMDLHARNTPNEISNSVDRLVTFLMSSCTNSLNTVRIFYMWISTHIRLTSIPCVLVHGVLKGAGREPASLLRYRTRPNHVWSLVLVKDQWRFVDCACGRGLQDDPRHADAIREFYFLPDPEHLIVSHFPLGMSSELLPLTPMGDNFRKGVGRTSVQIREGLQMLATPLKFGQFCQQAAPTVVAMETRLELLSHKHAYVTVCRGELLSFRSNGGQLSNIAAVLKDRNTEKEFKESVLCTRHGLEGDFRVFVKPPHCGTFRLSIYGQVRTGGDSFHLLVDYYLRVEEVEGKDVERGETFLPFPEHFGVWGATELAPQMGFSRRIFKFDVLACRTGDLYLKLPVTGSLRLKALITSPAALNGGDRQLQKLDKRGDTVSLLGVTYRSDGCEEENNIVDKIVKKSGNRIMVKTRDECSTLTQCIDNVVHIRGRFSGRGFYALSVFAQKSEASQESRPPSPASSSFTKIADFLVSCQKASPSIARRKGVGEASGPFPKMFPVAQTYQCLLLEPLARDLTLGVTVTFRIKSPLLVKVKVENEMMLTTDAYKERKKRDKKNEANGRAHGEKEDNDYSEIDDLLDDKSCHKEDGVWCLDYTPSCPGASLCIYGYGPSEQGMPPAYSALYMFQVGYLNLDQLKMQRRIQICSDSDTEIISIMTKM